MEIRVHEHFELCWHLIKIKHYDEISHKSRTLQNNRFWSETMTKKDPFFSIEFSSPTHPDTDYYRIREATMSDATYT